MITPWFGLQYSLLTITSDKAKDMLARANCKNGKANSKAKPTWTEEEGGWSLDVG